MGPLSHFGPEPGRRATVAQTPARSLTLVAERGVLQGILLLTSVRPAALESSP